MGTNYIPESISAGLDTTSSLNTNLTNIQTSLGRMLNTYGDSTVGTNAMHSDLDMNSQRVINLADGIANSDAPNIRQLQSLITSASVQDVTNASVVTSVANLKALSVSGLDNLHLAITKGYSSAGDGGEGSYYYDSSSSDTDNGGTVLAPDVGTGRWILIPTSTTDARVFGASPSASASANTLAIQASLDSYSENPIAWYDGEWTLPSGFYNIDGELQFPSSGTPEAHRVKLNFNGTLNQTDDTESAIKFNKIYHSEIRLGSIFGPTTNKFANNKAAVTFQEDNDNNKVYVPYISGGFTYGIHFNPTDNSKSEFNEYFLGKMYGPKYPIYFDGDGDSSLTHYFNANNFYGGSFNNTFYTAADGSEAIHLSDNVTDVMFHSPNFANSATGVNLTLTTGVSLIHPYFDSPVSGFIAGNLTSASNLVWVHGAGTAFEDLSFTMTALGRSNIFLNTSKSGSTKPVERIDQAGIGFLAPAAEDIDYYSQLSFSPTIWSLVNLDAFAQSQIMNKSYETGLSAPTAGTYRQGAIAWNRTTIGTGNTTGFMCKTEGTAGILNGGATTGGITSGTNTLTVNDATDIKYGHLLTVAGAGVTGNLVTGINGLVITLASNATTTVAGAAVSFTAPTWQQLPDFP